MNKLKLQIGEFSKLCGVTVKTLRHYEKLGLLTPFEVDEWTGYRYYRLAQLQRMSSIRMLKEVGFSLEEIGDLLDSQSLTPSLDTLEAKIAHTEQQLQVLQERRRSLQAMLNSQQKFKQMEKFTIENIPEMVVASHRCILPNYSKIGELCVNVIGPEMARLGCECPAPGYCYTFEHDKEYKAENIDFEYCEQVREAKQDSDIIHFRHEPAIPTALCMKCYGPYNRLYQGYSEILAYIEEKGYKIVGAPRANYIDGAWNVNDPEKWLTIIQVPIQQD